MNMLMINWYPVSARNILYLSVWSFMAQKDMELLKVMTIKQNIQKKQMLYGQFLKQKWKMSGKSYDFFNYPSDYRWTTLH